MSTVPTAVAASKALSMSIGDHLDALQLKASLRIRLAGTSLHIALTHHSSVPVLIEDGRHISAFALIRPEVESYIRGLWLAYLASEDQITGLESGDDPPNTRQLMQQLEDAGHFDPDSLTRIGADMWPTICDFPHTGIRAMQRHLTSDSIEPNFDDDEIIEPLRVADAWALMTGISLAEMAERSDIARVLLERGKAQFSTPDDG